MYVELLLLLVFSIIIDVLELQVTIWRMVVYVPSQQYHDTAIIINGGYIIGVEILPMDTRGVQTS